MSDTPVAPTQTQEVEAPTPTQIVTAGPVMIVLEVSEAEEFAKLDSRLPLELRIKLAQLTAASRGRRDDLAGERLEYLQHRRRTMTARRAL